ncbi:MAG TPA: HAD-IC family P-type ATPase, partial [Thermoplasmata archaeon]
SLAAAVESGSEHPMARAVLGRAASLAGGFPEAREVVAVPGRGVAGSVGGERCEILAGAAARKSGLPLGALEPSAVRLETSGFSWSVVLEAGHPIGLLAFSDQVRATSRGAIEALRSDGLDVVMVTGDHLAAARSVASQLGITQVHASVSPSEKVALVTRLQREGHRVAFVGDGVNDAAAILAADTGIAIGAGSDVAKEAGQIVLVRSEFTGVPMALRVARRTVRKVRMNLLWALGYNAVLLPIAAGVLVPVFGFALYALLPILGAVAMALSSTSVVLNSLSLRWIHVGVRSGPVA